MRYRAILANFPRIHLSRDSRRTGRRRRRGRLILAGGELLIDGVREELFYPTLDAIRERWGAAAPQVSMQTTGDVLTAPLHRGDARARRRDDRDRQHRRFPRRARGRGQVRADGRGAGDDGAVRRHARSISASRATRVRSRARREERRRGGGRTFLFFGAQPELWIGELWPRGRAWTKRPLARDLRDELLRPLERRQELPRSRAGGIRGRDRARRLGLSVLPEDQGSPSETSPRSACSTSSQACAAIRRFEAINAGDPERMGEAFGWERADFRRAATQVDPHRPDRRQRLPRLRRVLRGAPRRRAGTRSAPSGWPDAELSAHSGKAEQHHLRAGREQAAAAVPQRHLRRRIAVAGPVGRRRARGSTRRSVSAKKRIVRSTLGAWKSGKPGP